MKLTVITTMIALLTTASGEPAKPESPTKVEPQKEEITKAKPKPSALAALARYKGKKGKPSRNIMSATRSDDLPEMRLVALAPGDQGVTFLDQPRLWWHQSAATRGGELEFVLTDLTTLQPSVLIRRPIPPMKAGFNFIDLSNPRANPSGAKLAINGTYQWTVNLRSETKVHPVYCKIRRTKGDSPNDSESRIGWLAESGNWYELFDEVSIRAKQDSSTYTPIQSDLLNSAGLSKALESPKENVSGKKR